MNYSKEFRERLLKVANNNENVFQQFLQLAKDNNFHFGDLTPEQYDAESLRFFEFVLPKVKRTYYKKDSEGGKNLFSSIGTNIEREIEASKKPTWEDLKKKFDKPLQLTDEQVAWATRGSTITPETFRENVQHAWDEYAKKQGKIARENAEKQTANIRSQLQKDFENGKLDGETIFGNGAIGRGIANTIRHIGNNPFGSRVTEQNRRNVLQGTDESVLDDALVDLGQGLAETYIGGKVANAAIKGTTKALHGVKTAKGYSVANAGGAAAGAIGAGAGTGLANSAGQIADIGRGEQENFDFEKMKQSAEDAALIGVGASGVLTFMRKFPGLSNVAREAYKKVHGTSGNAAQAEKETMENLVGEARRAAKIGKRKRATAVQRGNMYVAEENAAKYANDPRVLNKNKKVDDVVSRKDLGWDEKKIKSYERRNRMDYPDAPPTKRQYELATPEEQRWYRDNYPETFKSYSEKPVKGGAKIGANVAAATAKVSQQGYARISGTPERKRKETESEKQKRWQNGNATWEEMQSNEYAEWKKNPDNWKRQPENWRAY